MQTKAIEKGIELYEKILQYATGINEIALAKHSKGVNLKTTICHSREVIVSLVSKLNHF